MSSDRPLIFLTVLASFGGSAWVIHSFMWGDLFKGAVAAIYSFRVYMEQIIFDSSHWLRPTTFLEDLSYAFDFLRAVYLFNHSNCSHPSLEVEYLFLCFMAVIHSLNCTGPFSFVVPPAVIYCHSLSFVVTRCHLFSLVAIHCNSLWLVVTLVVTRWHSMYHSSVFLQTILNNEVLLCGKNSGEISRRLFLYGKCRSL